MADPELLDRGAAPGRSNLMPQPSVDGNYQILKDSLSKIGGARLLRPPLDPLTVKAGTGKYLTLIFARCKGPVHARRPPCWPSIVKSCIGRYNIGREMENSCQQIQHKSFFMKDAIAVKRKF